MARDVSASLAIAAAAVTLVLVSATARAEEEVCVVCSGPEATYRCVPGELEQAVRRFGGVRSLEFLCISELARRGRHESCRVRRDAKGPCLGDQRALAPPGDEWAPAVTPEAERPQPQEADEPKTVEDLARRSVEASRQQLNQAGAAVGSAARKTWDCVAGMFRKC